MTINSVIARLSGSLADPLALHFPVEDSACGLRFIDAALRFNKIQPLLEKR
jgi:hypothetical protein